MPYEKLEKDGKIAVLFSPGYGAGWYSWNSDHEGLLFDKEIVEAVLDDDKTLARQIAERKYPGGYWGGARDLKICWVPKGSRFEVSEYDGSESVRFLEPSDGHVA